MLSVESLSPKRLRRLDHYYLVILRAAEQSLLPELYEVFGEKTFDLVDRFGGRTIEIPDRDSLERAVEDVSLYVEWGRAKDQKERGEVASTYKLSPEDAKARVDAVRDLIRGVGR